MGHRHGFALLAAAAVVAACGSSSSGSSSSAQACMDVATAVAKAAQRCGADYHTSYNQFVQSAANGNCSNVVQVRDSNALYQTCIPSFMTISCTDLMAGNIDATCRAQLLHN
jgi:hypothetical protein